MRSHRPPPLRVVNAVVVATGSAVDVERPAEAMAAAVVAIAVVVSSIAVVVDIAVVWF